jgi:DNA topoisomerase-6 subunit B
VRDVARDLKSHLNERRSLEKRREKETVISDILPKMAEKVASVTERDEPDVSGSLAKIMNNVLVRRVVKEGYVEVAVQNYSGSSVSLDVTEIVTAEPDAVSEGTVIDMEGEWFIQWAPDIASGETATLSYEVADESTFDLDIDGVPAEKLTIKQ